MVIKTSRIEQQVDTWHATFWNTFSWFETIIFVRLPLNVFQSGVYSGYGLSQWETTLQRNVVSHWLRQYQELSLQRIHLTISQHWFIQGPHATGQQPIIWSHVDIAHWRHMASLGDDELIVIKRLKEAVLEYLYFIELTRVVICRQTL